MRCAELNDDQYALQLAETIEEPGLQAQALDRLGIAKAQLGQIEAAQQIAGQMLHPDFVLASVAAAESAQGNAVSARATIDEIEFAAARVTAFQQIAVAQIDKDEMDDAVVSLDDAASAAAEIEHDEERIRALCDTGTIFLDAGRNDKAIELFDLAKADAEALDNIHRDHFLANCALGFLAAGSDELADGALDLVTDKTQMASALLGFAREYWKKGEKDDAFDALDEAYQIIRSQGDREIRDNRARNTLISSIAAQMAGFGKTDIAVEAALQNPDPAEQTAALTQIAQVLTFQKEHQAASETINEIADDPDRLSAMLVVFDELIRQD